MPCEFQNCERVIGRAQALGDRSRYSSVPTGGEQDDADEAARSVTLRLRSPAAQVSADHALSQTFTNKHQVVLGTRSCSFPLFHSFHFAGPSGWAVAQQGFQSCFEDLTPLSLHSIMSVPEIPTA